MAVFIGGRPFIKWRRLMEGGVYRRAAFIEAGV